MIVGMSIQVFTIVHVIISLFAIASGLLVVCGMICSRWLPKLTVLFWVMTALTSVTGFMFFLSPAQPKMFTPAAGTGLVATIVLLIALMALYARHLYGRWRWIYALGVVISLYLNVFVLIVQVFEKVKLVNPAAPMIGPPFAESTQFQFVVTQATALLIFAMLGLVAAIKFRRAPI